MHRFDRGMSACYMFLQVAETTIIYSHNYCSSVYICVVTDSDTGL